jgi:hypothetical protein
MYFIWVIVTLVLLLYSLIFIKKETQTTIKRKSMQMKQIVKPPNIMEFKSCSLIFIIHAFIQARYTENLHIKNFIKKILLHCKNFFDRNSLELDENVELRWLKKTKEDVHIFFLIDYLISGKLHSHTFKFLPQLLADVFNLELVFVHNDNRMIITPFTQDELKGTLEIRIGKKDGVYVYYVKSKDFHFDKNLIESVHQDWLNFPSKSIYDCVFEIESFKQLLLNYPQSKKKI